MRARRAALLVALLTAVSGCADDGLDAVADAVDRVEDEVDEELSEDDALADEVDEEEGEGRDPDALFGVDVCFALLPALDGDTAGLERYATPEVIAELSQGAEDGVPIAQDTDVYDGEGECHITLGDLTWTLELMGDGHVGDSAVAIRSTIGTDAAEDGDAIAAAVATYRASGDACGGYAEDELPEGSEEPLVYELDGLTVVAVECERFAYQSLFELWGWDDALFELDVEQWSGDDLVTGDGAMVLGYPYEEDGFLVNLEKGRGIGDCGLYQEWAAIDGERLALYYATSRDCDDESEYVEPQDWDAVYVADV